MEISLSPLLVGAIPVVLGVVSAVKKVGLSTKWAPLFSIFIGLVLSYFVGGSPIEIILQGLIVGLSASGLYSGTKTTLQ